MTRENKIALAALIATIATGLVPVLGLAFSGIHYVTDLTARVRSLESEEFVGTLRDRFKESVKADALRMRPIGMILPFYGKEDQVPDGFVLCDDRSLSRTEEGGKYRDLCDFLVVANPKLKIGDDLVKVPDLRGMFLRGLDPDGDIDPDGKSRSLGNRQDDQFQIHHHEVYAPAADNGRSTFLEAQVRKKFPDDGVNTAAFVVHHDSTNNQKVYRAGKLIQAGTQELRTGEETRPVNVAVNFIIKY